MQEVIVQGMPESLRRYIVEDCSIPASSFKLMQGAQLDDPARKLLFHQDDMTSTLAGYYGSKLYVECIQNLEMDEVYLREVFLRTIKTDTVVEYGVIAIVLESFTQEQQAIIAANQEPLGGLLHKFKINFTSAPVCFFAISAECLVDTPFKDLKGHTFYGRYNKLAKTSGEPIAWIMEILPDEPADSIADFHNA